MNDDSLSDGFLESDDALFHYTKVSVALEHILPDARLRLSLLRDTNDPREYKFKLLNMQGWSLPPGAEELLDRAHPVFDRILRNECRVVCFCTNAPPIVQTEDEELHQDPYSSNVGWSKSRMWSQYGENHRGLCLVLSKAAILQQLATVQETLDWFASGAVTYLKEDRIPRSAVTLDGNLLANQGVERYCSGHIESYHEALFLTKHVDYRDESEYRFIVADHNGRNESLNISNSLRAVVAGDRTPKVYFPLIRTLAEKYQAACRHAYWDRGKAHLLQLVAKEKA